MPSSLYMMWGVVVVGSGAGCGVGLWGSSARRAKQAAATNVSARAVSRWRGNVTLSESDKGPKKHSTAQHSTRSTAVGVDRSVYSVLDYVFLFARGGPPLLALLILCMCAYASLLLILKTSTHAPPIPSKSFRGSSRCWKLACGRKNTHHLWPSIFRILQFK